MIRALILYYLNVKPTHGYEIQKFLQISEIDNWSKIQSGSIYYALAKLEKDGCIEVLREEKNGAKIRKIYGITESGKEELKKDLQKELLTPITYTGSDKFFLNNILDVLSKEAITSAIEKHLTDLKQQKEYWEKWKLAKVQKDNVLKAEKIAFDMTIDSLKYQIMWHEEILINVERYILLGKETRRVIETIDFSNVDDTNKSETADKLMDIQRLREEIISNPQKAVENIDRLIEKLKNN